MLTCSYILHVENRASRQTASFNMASGACMSCLCYPGIARLKCTMHDGMGGRRQWPHSWKLICRKRQVLNEKPNMKHWGCRDLADAMHVGTHAVSPRVMHIAGRSSLTAAHLGSL